MFEYFYMKVILFVFIFLINNNIPLYTKTVFFSFACFDKLPKFCDLFRGKHINYIHSNTQHKILFLKTYNITFPTQVFVSHIYWCNSCNENYFKFQITKPFETNKYKIQSEFVICFIKTNPISNLSRVSNTIFKEQACLAINSQTFT